MFRPRSMSENESRESEADEPRARSSRFEDLFEEVAPALYAWAELRIRPALRARLDPQDLVQEVWLRGQDRFRHFDERGIAFRAWIFRIGKNVLLEALRAARTAALVSGPGSTGSGSFGLDRIPQSVTSFTQRLAREDSVRAFLAHAESLHETDRMLLIHCGLEGEACAEAALKLGLTEDAAIKRWQRLRAKLREAPWARALLGSAEEDRPDARDPGPAK